MNNNVTLREVNRVVLSCTLAIVLVICKVNGISVKETFYYLLLVFILRIALFMAFTIFDATIEFYTKED